MFLGPSRRGSPSLRLWEEASERAVRRFGSPSCLRASKSLRFVFAVKGWFLRFLFEKLVRALLISDDLAFCVRVGATVAGTMGSAFEIGAVSNRFLCSITCVVRRLFSDLKRMRPCDTLVALC